MASIVALYIVISDKNQKDLVKGLMGIIAALSLYTSYLLYENQTYESEQYQQISDRFQKSLDFSQTSREASNLLRSFPNSIDRYDVGTNEGIIYSVLAFLEPRRENFPELYDQFKSIIIADIEEAKLSRDSFRDEEILENGAKAALMLLGSIASDDEN